MWWSTQAPRPLRTKAFRCCRARTLAWSVSPSKAPTQQPRVHSSLRSVLLTSALVEQNRCRVFGACVSAQADNRATSQRCRAIDAGGVVHRSCAAVVRSAGSSMRVLNAESCVREGSSPARAETPVFTAARSRGEIYFCRARTSWPRDRARPPEAMLPRADPPRSLPIKHLNACNPWRHAVR
jgi:hypothetical protein